LKKILVTGLSGFIGTRLSELFHRYSLIGVSRSVSRNGRIPARNMIKADITDEKELSKKINNIEFDGIIHLAGITHIDRCEEDKINGKNGLAWKVNVTGTENIIRACSQSGKFLLFLSTECVFDGKKGFYKESDTPSPVNWYGRTKYEAEKKILSSKINACILRSVLVYGHSKGYKVDLAKKFFELLKSGKKISAVNDQFVTFTFIDDLIGAINLAWDKKLTGIYHFAAETSLSPFEFARTISSGFGLNNKMIKQTTLEKFFGKSHRLRLVNSSLNSDKFREFSRTRAKNLEDVVPILVKRWGKPGNIK